MGKTRTRAGVFAECLGALIPNDDSIESRAALVRLAELANDIHGALNKRRKRG